MSFGHSLLNIVRRRVARRIARIAVLDIRLLVHADVVDVHMARENQVLEILSFEGR